MKRDDLLLMHETMCKEARDIMRKKNEDYAGESDPFANFRAFGSFGVLVRLSDKLARLRNYENRGEFSVKEESIQDTVLDAINYCIIYLAMKYEEAGRKVSDND